MRLSPFALAAVPLLVSSAALAGGDAGPCSGLAQPSGECIPSAMGCNSNEPTGLEAVMACACTQPNICDIGAACPGGSASCDPGKNGTCEATLWHSQNDNSCIPSNESGLNVATAAAIKPETFHPTCGQTFTVVSRGTAEFQDVFGWYNATSSTQPPDPSDLHIMIQCTDKVGTSATLDVTSDPSYKGGDIGFFLLTPEDHTKGGTCAAEGCCPTIANYQAGQGYVYYSQLELNPDYSASAPYIHMLNIPSAIFPNRYYFAWEDTFDTTSADFTDIVVGVDGVQCSGAGVSCGTGKLGACAIGVTECSQGATTPSCHELIDAGTEICNGVDDDCDGTVDNGATCPSANEVCFNGACVTNCGSENFCTGGRVCDSTRGFCVAPGCVGVSCTSDQVCVGGTCVTACAGVVCPFGETCLNNECVDLCGGVKCASGESCNDGVCFPGCTACGGLTCTSPLQCDQDSGACADPSCSSPCATGQHCSSGKCVDNCTGATCPGGATCSNGQCTTAASGDAGGGKIDLGDSGSTGTGADGGKHHGGSSGGSSDASADGALDGGSTPWGPSGSSCGCSVPGLSTTSVGYAGALLGAMALAGSVSRRRRRSSSGS